MSTTLRRSTLPALVLLGFCLLAAVAGYFTAGDQRPRPPTAVAPTATSPAETTFVGGRVVSFNDPNLVIDDGNGPKTYSLTGLSNETGFEMLQPIKAAEIKAGDWINAGATDNTDTVFTLGGLVVIPAERVQAP
jgi:hypothetical protein